MRIDSPDRLNTVKGSGKLGITLGLQNADHFRTLGHPRCKTDEMIKRMAATGGVMGITSFRSFVKNSDPTTIEDVIDHFDHVAKLVGVEHVGVDNDSDLQPDDSMSLEDRKKLQAAFNSSYGFREKFYIDGLNHPKRAFDLTETLIRRKYSDNDIEMILGGNFNRALNQIWKPSAGNAAQ